MPPIPGANRIGQGFPGGGPALAGLPGGPALPLNPGLQGLQGLKIPRVNVPRVPTPALNVPGVVHVDQQGQQHNQRRLEAARNILSEVHMGRLEPKKAAKMLDDLTGDERKTLAREVMIRGTNEGGVTVQSELRALRYLPEGKDPGMTASNDPQRGTGVGSNLVNDAFGTVVGLPAGLGLAGVAVGKDVGDIVRDPTGKHHFQHTTNEILKPIAKSYKDTYGPALHGDFSGLAAHPLMPILDAASLVSGGLGAAGRVGEAARAARAARVVEVPGEGVLKIGDKALPKVKGIKVEEMPEGSRMQLLQEVRTSQFKDPKAAAIAQQALINGTGGKLFVARDARSGKLLGISHHMPGSSDPADTSMYLNGIASTGEKPGTGTALMRAIAEHTVGEGRTHINLQSTHSAEGFYKHLGMEEMLPGQDAGYFSGDVTKDPTYVTTVGAPNGRVSFKQSLRDVQARISPKDHNAIFEISRSRKIPFDEATDVYFRGDRPVHYTVHERKAESLPPMRDETVHETAARVANEAERLGKHDVAKELREVADVKSHGHEVQISYPIVPGQFQGVEELDRAIEALAGEYGGEIAESGSGLGNRDYSIQFYDQGNHDAFMDRLKSDHPDVEDHGAHGITRSGLPVPYDHAELQYDLDARGIHGSPELIPHAQPQKVPMGPASAPVSKFTVRDNRGRLVAQNFADKESAIKHAQSLISPHAVGKSSALRAGIAGFAKGGGSRGRLIDRYEEARGFNHDLETHNMMEEIAGVLDNSKLRMDRRTVKQVAKEVWGDLQKTRAEGRRRGDQIAAENPGFFSAYPVRKGLAAGETALREASDLVRAGAIYLRPAYLPNNWAGNFFMNAVHQGVLAPVNLAKSLVIDKHIGKRYTAAIDKAMGQNAAEVVTAAKGRGYVGSITNPVAHSMGMLADQPFRRAAFLHEARRAGYSKLSDVQKLFDRAMKHETTRDGEKALREIADIGRRAQEEIVKFNHFNDTERAVVRNLIFVYAWVRGSARYAARFAAQHPIQADAFQHLSNDVGNPYLQKELGGVPSYLLGAVPVGHDKNGNPILINPFSLNPLGTAVDVARAVHGTAKVIKGDRSFNKYVDTDVANLTNPLIQSYLTAREGGKKPLTQLEQTIAPIRLAHDLAHPGSGSVFPTSRTEALGHYTVGALFPRIADQAALTRSLEREQQDNPTARIGTDLKLLEKYTGEPLDKEFVDAYKADLVKVKQLKDFQNAYASAHGSSGFRNLPAANRLDAALKFLQQQKLMSPAELQQIRDESRRVNSDAELNSIASALWGSTGIGGVKREWDSLLNEARNATRKTRQRG